ncbi:MAG: hypothetical protein GY756_27875 [bacterium]|nr:hypothetical protein [bacterium]
MKYHDERLINELKEYIERGDILVEYENSKYYNELKKIYPYGQSQINWGEVKNKYEYISQDNNDTGIVAIKFLEEIRSKHNINENQEIIYFGDIIDLALHMKYSDFIKNIDIFLSYPQDSYIVPITFDWCFNCLLEDDLYFGFKQIDGDRAKNS